jgi:hypothetical protein
LENIVVPPSSFSSGPIRTNTCPASRSPQWTWGSSTLVDEGVRERSPSIVPIQPSLWGIPSGVAPWSSGCTAIALSTASIE